MGIRLPSVLAKAKQIYKTRNNSDVPKGHVAVYVGQNEKTRHVIPISYLNHPFFQELLHQAAEEFGFDHPTGGLSIPCEDDVFIKLASSLKF